MMAGIRMVGVIPVIGTGPGEDRGRCGIMQVERERETGELVGARHRVNGRGPGVLSVH